MPASPGIDIRLFDLTVYSPQISSAIVGCVGPATKGPVNTLTTFTDEGNFVTQHGRPIDRQFAPRALIRYLKRGNQGKFVRVAGKNLKSATLTLFDVTGRIPVLILTAASPGSWANTDLAVSVTWNGPQNNPSSYNISVYFLGQLAEPYLVLTNGIVVNRINSGSTRLSVQLAPNAGATFPAQTLNPVTQAVTRLGFSGGDDGAFAKSDSTVSSTGPFAGQRFHGKDDAIAGSRVFENQLTIGAAQAAKAIFYGSLGMPVVPGTFTIRVQTAAGPTFVELADAGQFGSTISIGGMGSLLPAAGAHTGYIDYRTGNYGIKLAGGPTLFLGGTIDAIFVRGNSESVGSTARGNAIYAGNISQFPMGVGFFNESRAFLTFRVQETVNNGSVVGASINSTGATMKALAGWIVPGSLVLTPIDATNPVPNPVYDDGFGGLRTQPLGGGLALTGAVNYRTGAFNVTWDPTQANPTITSATTTVQAQYDIVVTDMGGGTLPGPTGVLQQTTVQPSAPAGATVASTDVGAQALQVPIHAGTVRFNISATAGGPFACWDDGFGNLLTSPRGTPQQATVTGSINYNTGAWTITPPAPFTPVTALAVITATWVQKAEDFARRTMRGTGPQALGAGGFNAVGVLYDDPSANNASPFNGSTFLDHRTGVWGVKFALLQATTLNTFSFDFQDKAAITAVYCPAILSGVGDGTNTLFKGTLSNNPYRRQANRLRAFKGSEASAAGAGDPSESYATLGATDAADFWSENVVAIPDPSNFVNFRTGIYSFKWSGAPLLAESTFVVADDTVLNVDAKYPGDLGNERSPLTAGFYVSLTADPTLAGTLLFQTWFNGVAQESFGQQPNLAALVAIVNDPTNGSQLVSLRLTPEGNFLPADVTGLGQNVGLNGAFTLADVIGAKVGQTYTGLQMFANSEVVPVNWLMLPGSWHRQAIVALQQLCEKRGRRAIGIIPSPDLNDPFAHAAFFDGTYNATSPGGPPVPTVLVPYPPLAAIDSSQLATVVPFVQYFDQYTNNEVFEPADGEMANLVAGTPAPWFPIAGFRRGQVNVDGLRYSASQDDRDLIYGVVGTTTEIVNTIIRKEGRGILLYGQRTAQRNPSALDRINVRWTVNVIMNLLDLISQEFVFEINDPILWREVAQALNKVLSPIVERRGLEDAFVVCDSTTTTAAMIDNLQMGAKLFIKPARAAEFLIYDLILTPTGADFASITVAG